MLTTTKISQDMKAALLHNTSRSCSPPVVASTSPYTPSRVEKNVVYSPAPPVELPQDDISGLIFSRAKRWAHNDAIECGVTGRKYSYGGMVDRALRWGAVVSQLLACPSSTKTLAIFCINAPEFPILLLGTLAVGANVTTINTIYTADEVAEQLEDSGSEVIVTDPQLEHVVTEALAKLNKTLPVFVNGDSSCGHPNLRHILEDTTRPLAEPVKSDLQSTAIMVYSSGTTGKPKGVEHCHGSITAGLASNSHPDFRPFYTTAGEVQYSVMGVMPFCHIFGLFIVNLVTLYLGGKVVSVPSFNLQGFIRIIQDHKIRVLPMVPSMLKSLVSSPMATPDHLASVLRVSCIPMRMLPSEVQAFKEKAPNLLTFREPFGMTEVLGVLSMPGKEERISWCGKCLPGVEAKVIDLETSEALPEGQRGELCIRSPTLMTRYHNDPTTTAKTIDADGWLHTGDVAIHQHGSLTIVDRVKDLIKVKSFLVSPSELEGLLLQHPAVEDVGVVGVEDERAGELPRAYVVCRGDTTEEDLHQFLEPRVAEYMKLKGGIRFIDIMPKNSTGKIVRKDLKAMAAKDV